MAFLSDTRAQSIQIGAILLFGIFIISFITYQAFIVPEQNRNVEYNHFSETQNDIEEVRNAIIQAGNEGGAVPASVRLGTNYPSRVVAAQPQRSGGTVRIEPIGSETNRYELQSQSLSLNDLCGIDTLTNSAVTYNHNYNYLNSINNISSENTVTYTTGAADGRSFQTDQQLIQGTTIHLYPLVGEYNEGGSDLSTLTFVGNKTGRTSLSGTFSLIVPSRLSATTWENTLLSEQDHVTSVTPASGQAVKINFNDAKYTINCSPVGVGQAPNTDPVYDQSTGNQGGGTAYNITWTSTTSVPGLTSTSGEICQEWPCDVTLQATTDPVQIGAPVGFAASETAITTVFERLNVTDSNGLAQTTAGFERTEGNTTLWTNSGGANDSLIVSTPLTASFETSLATDDFGIFGSFLGDDSDKLSDQGASSGELAALIDGGNDGGIITTGYDTTGGESVVVQYWVENSDVGDTDDSGGELQVEYQTDTGNWELADSIPQNDATVDSPEIHTNRLGDDAIHTNFSLRFRQVGADNANDEWLIDDPTITVLGTQVGPGEPGGRTPSDDGNNGGGGGDTTPPSINFASATHDPNDPIFGPNDDDTVEFVLDATDASGLDRTILTATRSTNGMEYNQETVTTSPGTIFPEILDLETDASFNGNNGININITVVDTADNSRTCTGTIDNSGDSISIAEGLTC